MKKKILALCLVVVLAITAVTGATLAYFTETEQVTNEFAVGNVKIDLYEDFKQEDGNGTVKVEQVLDSGKGTDVNKGAQYVEIQPTDVMTKVATVENTGASEAYIALVIKNEGYLKFNQNIDDYYEAMSVEDMNALGIEGDTLDECLQFITDSIWSGSGWGLRYTKPNPATDLRYEMERSQGAVTGNAAVLGYGYANSTWADGRQVWNYSGNVFEEVMRSSSADMDGNFDSLTDAHTRMWVIYLMVPAGGSYTVDLTTTCPAFIDNSSIEAFSGMKLDIKAFAIQTNGFADAHDAFAEVFKADDCFAY